ncbi:hypothetical protein L560_1649 [Bordetella pertussis STO1-CHOC-0018]|nr:hypothetical protein L560_1649 [Bordetella pertussis STO1-CHOC-0018]
MAKPASDMPPYDKAAALRGLAGARRVALLMAPRLGDTLLMMNMARNLAAHGREVSIFGDYIHGLRDWFPGLDIRPSLSEEQAGQVLPGYDCAAQMHVGWPYALHAHQPNYFYYDAHVAITGRGFVKLFQIRDFCREQLGLAQAGADNGLRPPPQVQPHRSHPRRVALHPTSDGGPAVLGAAPFQGAGAAPAARGLRAELHRRAARAGRVELGAGPWPASAPVSLPVRGGGLHPCLGLVHRQRVRHRPPGFQRGRAHPVADRQAHPHARLAAGLVDLAHRLPGSDSRRPLARSPVARVALAAPRHVGIPQAAGGRPAAARGGALGKNLRRWCTGAALNGPRWMWDSVSG